MDVAQGVFSRSPCAHAGPGTPIHAPIRAATANSGARGARRWVMAKVLETVLGAREQRGAQARGVSRRRQTRHRPLVNALSDDPGRDFWGKGKLPSGTLGVGRSKTYLCNGMEESNGGTRTTAVPSRILQGRTRW